jgi:hypothetical protein
MNPGGDEGASATLAPTPRAARAAAGAESVQGRLLRELVHLGIIAFQFGLIVLLVRAFQIESKAFLRLLALAFAGFLIHHFLPQRYRLGFFAALSLAGTALVLGPTHAAWLTGFSAVLIGLAHVPIAFWGRVALIVAAATGFALIRAGEWDAGVPGVVWPLLGSMFMFRLWSYLYDLKHAAAPFSLERAVAYFFMLPNVCFPLFPVVDYKKFCSSHFNAEPFGIYQQGVVYMLRGIVHLLLYRLVYQNFLVDPATLQDASAALQLMLSTYLLYLRISGSFHLIVGLLHLFGFHLSETHHLYLLASSFTDYWRRINIYWKDFIQKLFFNPTYFAVSKKTSATGAMTIATLVAFFFTWILHSYQWFWIRGTFMFTWQDTVFWWGLCFLVLANVLVEMRRPPAKRLGKVARSWKADLRLGLSTILTFVVVCGAWTVWTAGSGAELGLIVEKLGGMTWKDAGWIALALGTLGVAAILLGRRASQKTEVRTRTKTAAPAFAWGPALRTVALAGALLGVAKAPALLAFSPVAADALDRLKAPNRLSARDAQTLERGYYEDLVDISRFNDELAELYAKQPPDWSKNRAVLETKGYPPYELIPSTSVHYKGATYSTNAFGMRDREYAQAKPAGTMRFVLLGASHGGGSGVGDDQTYENVTEDRLNAERAGRPAARYEILNFCVGGYGPLCRLRVLETKALGFQPDVLLYEGINDLTWVVNEIAHAADQGVTIPFPHVVERARAAGVEPGLPRVVAEKKIRPLAAELVEWAYVQMVERCRANGVRPMALFLPRPEDRSAEQADFDLQKELATRAGFELVDVWDAYAALEDPEEIWIAPWDRHPNPDGHRMVAEKLYSGLVRQVLEPPAGR